MKMPYKYCLVNYEIIGENPEVKKYYDTIIDKINKHILNNYKPFSPFELEVRLDYLTNSLEDRFIDIIYYCLTDSLTITGWLISGDKANPNRTFYIKNYR